MNDARLDMRTTLRALVSFVSSVDYGYMADTENTPAGVLTLTNASARIWNDTSRAARARTRRLVDRGELEARRVGTRRDRLVVAESVDDFLARR